MTIKADSEQLQRQEEDKMDANNGSDQPVRLTLTHAFTIILEERDDIGRTMFQRFDRQSQDFGISRAMHQVAMKLVQYGVEIVKYRYDREQALEIMQGMRRNRILKKVAVPETEDIDEFLDWIADTAQITYGQLTGKSRITAYHRDFLENPPSVRDSLSAILGQELGEFSLVRILWSHVFEDEPIVFLPSPSSLGILDQDYLRTVEDTLKELGDAYNLYKRSVQWRELTIQEELLIEERLYRTVEDMGKFMGKFRDYDDDVIRNLPDPLSAYGKNDREAVRKMSTPFRLRLKEINGIIAKIGDFFTEKLKTVKRLAEADAPKVKKL